MRPNLWTEDVTVRLHELDAGGNLSILSICDFLQSAASNHARALGISLNELQATGYTWVLAQLKIHMDDYPSGKTPIRIQTWPAGIDRLYALREFRIVDGNGRLYGVAGSSWLILDMERRRPVRVEPFVAAIQQTSDHGDVSAGIERLPALDAPEYTRKFRVRYRDLDVNQHVNNVSYVEWSLESLPASVLTAAFPADLEVNFSGEAHLGDTVMAQAKPLNTTGNAFIHHIFRKESGESLFKARSVWTDRPKKGQGMEVKP